MLLIVFFLFWEGDSCSSSFFVLGGRSVLLIVVCFGREIRVANRFFVLGGGSVFLIVVCFGREIRAAHCCLF